MAYTRIHAIKTTLNKALDYIENPDKTEEQLLVSGYNVDPLSASIEFEMTAALARELKGDYTKTGGAEILAFHMIQSFAPYDKLTPEKAHEIGRKWADEILQGKHEYVISTHVDKGHIHNHIIFNSVSFYDYKKFETKPYKTAAQLRKVSDKLCQEYDLHVIKNPNLKQKSATHYEWEQRKAGTSWKAQIKEIIDQAIAQSTDYEGFTAAMAAANVEIKEGKRISFRIAGTDQERFVRGDRIGEDYSRERILERLAAPKKKKREKVLPPTESREGELPNAHQLSNKQPASYDKRIEWEARRTKIAETKELAAALMTIRTEQIQSETDFEKKLSGLKEKAAEVRETISTLSEKNQQYRTAAKYLLAFNQYLPVKQEYEKQSFLTKKKFYGLHEGELKAFEHAAAQLENLGVNSNVDPEKVMGLVKDHDGKVAEYSAALKAVTERIDQIQKARVLVEQIQKEAAGQEQEQKQDKQKSR